MGNLYTKTFAAGMAEICMQMSFKYMHAILHECGIMEGFFLILKSGKWKICTRNFIKINSAVLSQGACSPLEDGDGFWSARQIATWQLYAAASGAGSQTAIESTRSEHWEKSKYIMACVNTYYSKVYLRKVLSLCLCSRLQGTEIPLNLRVQQLWSTQMHSRNYHRSRNGDWEKWKK